MNPKDAIEYLILSNKSDRLCEQEKQAWKILESMLKSQEFIVSKEPCDFCIDRNNKNCAAGRTEYFPECFKGISFGMSFKDTTKPSGPATMKARDALRKCVVGREMLPAYFHGWFQYGNSEGGMDAMGVVEFMDGKTDFYAAGYITFDNS